MTPHSPAWSGSPGKQLDSANIGIGIADPSGCHGLDKPPAVDAALKEAVRRNFHVLMV
jgi:hypothetical protein